MIVSQNLNVYQGVNFTGRITGLDDDGTATNLSGYFPTGAVRLGYGEPNVLTYLTLSILSGANEVNPNPVESGIIEVSLTAAQTSGIIAVEGRYDINIYSGLNNKLVSQGKFNVFPEITT